MKIMEGEPERRKSFVCPSCGSSWFRSSDYDMNHQTRGECKLCKFTWISIKDDDYVFHYSDPYEEDRENSDSRFYKILERSREIRAEIRQKRKDVEKRMRATR